MIVDYSYFSTDSEEEKERVKTVLNVIAMLSRSLCFFGRTEVSFTRNCLVLLLHVFQELFQHNYHTIVLSILKVQYYLSILICGCSRLSTCACAEGTWILA